MTLAATLAAPASAFRLPQAPVVVWSFPVDGQLGVPTNARFWLLTRDAVPLVSFNGVGLAELDTEVPSYLLPDLEPSTPYSLLVVLTPVNEEFPPAEVEITFATGAGPDLEEPTGVNIERTIYRNVDATFDPCREVSTSVERWAPYMSDGEVELETDDSRAVLRLVWASFDYTSSVYGPWPWPNDCGALTIGASVDIPTCYFVESISSADRRSIGPRFCVDIVPGGSYRHPARIYPNGESDDSGCTTVLVDDDDAPHALFVVAVALTLVVRTRARRSLRAESG